jgi:hypothetical protein
MEVRALRDFMSPTMGDISTGQVFELDSGIAFYWLGAGLVERTKPLPHQEIETKPEPIGKIQTKRGRPKKVK